MIRKIAAVLLIIMLWTSIEVFATDTGNTNTTQTAPASETSYSTGSVSYAEYLDLYKSKEQPSKEIVIAAAEFIPGDVEHKIMTDYLGVTGKSVLTGDDENIEWEFDVENEGLYAIKVEYCPVEGKKSSMEREIRIDGKIPFEAARSVTFTRIWSNSSESILNDASGNEYRPVQIESPSWQNAFISGTVDYRDESYLFYFSKGSHRIGFQSIKEPMMIKTITLCQEKKTVDYKTVMDALATQGKTATPLETAPIKIQGEKAKYKSDATLYPIADFSSPANEPSSLSRSVLNTIGGENWKYPGQWLSWDFTVEKSGFYKLSFRCKQNFKSGSYSCREISIDGLPPFVEAAKMKFKYDLGWMMTTLSDDKNQPYYLYLEEGPHTLGSRVVLGDQGEILRLVQDSVTSLNAVYRKIMMITGAFPDPLRDYNLSKQLPEIIGIFEQCSKDLYAASEKLSLTTGGKGQESVQMEKTAYQLSDFAQNPDTIPKRLDKFNSNLNELGAWLLSTTEQPLAVDYILVSPIQSSLPPADAPWYSKIYTEIAKVVLSFFENYDTIGDTSTKTKDTPISLWLGAGRDQAAVMKSLITNQFTAQTGINVDLRLVNMEILLRAVSAGSGPDLALAQAQSIPVNYALRGALYDLTQFNDLKQVAGAFSESALDPFKIGERLYALPEQQIFDMMFYRKDVLAELDITVPQTWDEIYKILPVLQRNNLEIGLPSPFVSGTDTNLNSILLQFLYQTGGTIYNEDKSRCILDNETGIAAFTKWSELYTKYKLPQKVDMLTRFRVGETPIVITPYSFYNQLFVAAPEIRGLWEMTLVPGAKGTDGTIHREAAGTSTGAVIFKNSKNKDKAWEFLKWWTGVQAQTEYGREIEALLGQSGRWCTANKEAMKQLAWPTRVSKNIEDQWQWVRSIPEVPGGYYTSRNMDNSIRTVVNSGEDPKETLIDNVKIINDEIILKRKEFSME